MAYRASQHSVRGHGGDLTAFLSPCLPGALTFEIVQMVTRGLGPQGPWHTGRQPTTRQTEQRVQKTLFLMQI